MASSAEAAWGRVAGGSVVSAGLVQGRSLECSDGFAFYSPETVRHCAIERLPGEVEISIEGARCFHLMLPEPTVSVVINGVRRSLDPRWRRAAFTEDGAGWRLSEIDC
jgi:hypothetical protein